MPDNRNIRNCHQERDNDERWMAEQSRNPRAKAKDVDLMMQSSAFKEKDKRNIRSKEKRKMRPFYMNNPYEKEEKALNYLEEDIFDTEAQELEQATDGVSQKSEVDEINNQEQQRAGKEKGKTNTNYFMALTLMGKHEFRVFDEQLYTYDEKGYWELIPETDANRKLRSMIPDIYRDDVNKNMLREMYEWLRIEAMPMECDKEVRKKYLNFKNCILDWETGEILDHTPEYNLRYQLQIEYAECNEGEKPTDSAFCRFVTDVFGDDQETIREFAKFLGLCLSDIRWLKLCCFLYGPSNTGKSVFLNLLKLLIGEKWTSSVSFAQMSNEFAVTQLLGKRINLSAEVSGTTNKRLDIFKSLTGNDTITACFKGKDHFQFVNECLLVFACNTFPSVQSLGDFESFLSRLIVFPFTNVKERSEWIDDLEHKLLQDSSHIIQMAINGLHYLQEDGFCFNESAAMKRCKQEFIGQYNSFLLFAEQYIEEDPEGTVMSSEIGAAYAKFCQEEEYPRLADNVWVPIVKQKFRCVRKIIERIDERGMKRRARGFEGITLIRSMEEKDESVGAGEEGDYQG